VRPFDILTRSGRIDIYRNSESTASFRFVSGLIEYRFAKFLSHCSFRIFSLYQLSDMIFTNTKLILLQLVLVPSVAGAFRPVENPTGLEGLKTPLVLKKPPATPPTVNDGKNVITAKTMEQVGRASAAKRTDKEAISYEDEYWYDPRIHNFGNVGFLGAIHAVLAPISTKVIDELAYDGQDIRSIVSKMRMDRVY